jgi:hypothetical protein
MKRVVALLLVVALSVGSLSGCANIQDDGTRTKTEASMVGVVFAATVATTASVLTGQDAKTTVAIATAAAVIGAGLGWGVGSHIADQKAKYANDEAWLEACLQQARKANADLKAHNQELKGQVAALDRQTKKLQADYAVNRADRQQLLAERSNIEKTVEKNKQYIVNAEAEITAQQKVLADARANNKNRESALLEAEIAALQRQKTQLEKTNQQLASMSARISV